VCIFCFCLFFTFFLLSTVEGSASWRIPLGFQLIPGITLAIGCVFLPPSPRLLVAQGRNDEALQTLAKLRLRSEIEVQDDPLLQVRSLAFYYSHPSPRAVHLVPGSHVFASLLSCHSSCLSLSLAPFCFPGQSGRLIFISYPFFRLVVLSIHTHGLAIWTNFRLRCSRCK